MKNARAPRIARAPNAAPIPIPAFAPVDSPEDGVDDARGKDEDEEVADAPVPVPVPETDVEVEEDELEVELARSEDCHLISMRGAESTNDNWVANADELPAVLVYAEGTVRTVKAPVVPDTQFKTEKLVLVAVVKQVCA